MVFLALIMHIKYYSSVTNTDLETVCVFYFFIIILILREYMRVGGRGRGRESQADYLLSWEPNWVGVLNLLTDEIMS